MNEGQAIATVALGYALQWAKSFKNLPTWAMQLVAAALTTVCYFVLVGGPQAGHVREWIGAVIQWALTALGVASVTAAAGVAPKTDSIH